MRTKLLDESKFNAGIYDVLDRLVKVERPVGMLTNLTDELVKEVNRQLEEVICKTYLKGKCTINLYNSKNPCAHSTPHKYDDTCKATWKKFRKCPDCK